MKQQNNVIILDQTAKKLIFFSSIIEDRIKEIMLISSIIFGKIRVTIEWAKGNPLDVYIYSIQSMEIIGT